MAYPFGKVGMAYGLEGGHRVGTGGDIVNGHAAGCLRRELVAKKEPTI